MLLTACPTDCLPECVQVLMDVSGVLITCATCHVVLDQLAQGLKVAA